MPSSVTMKQLLEMGVHFGHRTQKWNPKMAPYIFTQRNGIHILDLQQTIKNLNEYYDMIRDLVRNNGTVLFVGTKRQAQETIAEEAKRCNMPYINTRWLGGTPNKVIARRLDISVHTAKFHVAAILTKLGAANRTDAIAIAMRQGLVLV